MLLALGFILFTTVSQNSFAAKSSGQIQVKGSDTEVNVVQLLAEKYMAKNKTVSISVTGGGSGTGIAALFNKTADLANSSRAMKEEELTQAKASNMDARRIVFATDALSVIVNKENPLKQLSVDQISKLFTGEIKNWKEIGGQDVTVSLYGRQSNSGTFSFFREFVVKADYSPDMKGLNGNSQITEAVKTDKGGVGYVGVAYAVDPKTSNPVAGIKVLSVAMTGSTKFVSPLDEKNVKSGKYPVARPLYQYFVAAAGKSSALTDFLKYELSPEGQKIIHGEGFYEIKAEWKTENVKIMSALGKN